MKKFIKINSVKNKQNLGIQFLRTVLCFWVVCFHCCNSNNIIFHIILKRTFHVPTFIVISFYFLLKNLIERDINKINRRFERLLIPYIIWPCIIWFLNNFIYICIKNNRFHRLLTLYDLIIQIIVGRKYFSVFWFQFSIIFLSVFFFIISFLFKKQFLFILQIIGILSYILQYSGWNYYYFSGYNSSIRLSIGYFSEIIPIAISGLTLSKFNIIEKISNNSNKAIFFNLVIIYFLFRYEIFVNINGFTYRGIISNFGSIFLFLFFSVLPFNHLKNNTFILIIRQITSFTMGIYCLHELVRDYLQKIITLVKDKDIKGCIIIYLVSYFLSFICYHIVKKSKLKYLFI